MNGHPSIALDVAKSPPATSECKESLTPSGHIEALRDTLRQDWLQFRAQLDQVALEQFNRQEEIIARCFESVCCHSLDGRSDAPPFGSEADPCKSAASGKDCFKHPSASGVAPLIKQKSFLSDSSLASWSSLSHGQSPRQHYHSPTKLQDMVESTKTWNGQRSVLSRRAPPRLVEYTNRMSELQEPPRTGMLARLVKSKSFDLLCIFVIVTNAALSAVGVNNEISTLSTQQTLFLQASEYFFLAFYTMELVLKLAVHRLYYFCNADMNWNIFDAVLVAFSLFDQTLTLIMASSGGDFTFMRTLRILRMARVLRGLRVMRFFSELRLMLNSLIGSISSLMWSILMMALIFYIFGLVFVQGVANFFIDQGVTPSAAREEFPDVLGVFGSVQRACLSLFQACTGGEDWHQFLGALEPVGAAYSGLFIFFIAFSQIALLNILTAIFVQRAMKLAQPDRETQAMMERHKEIEDIEELRRVIREADHNGNGKLSVSEFCKHIKRGKLGAQLSALGLNVKNAPVFFALVAQNLEEEELDIDDFVERCMRMRGSATCIDMHEMNMQLDRIQHTHQELHGNFARVMQVMSEVLDRMVYQQEVNKPGKGATQCSQEEVIKLGIEVPQVFHEETQVSRVEATRCSTSDEMSQEEVRRSSPPPAAAEVDDEGAVMQI